MSASISATEAERPNIIIIYADDVGYGDLGCYGATGVDTPNLDTLARDGVRFTSAYATASTCTPSRYSLLTGEYPFRNREAVILPGNAPLIIDPAKPTLAKTLRDAGYATALVGKWHLGLGRPDMPLDWNGHISPGPMEVGFEYSYHMAATGDRVPSVYIENGKIVGLDPADPVEVSYQEPIGDEPTGVSHPHLLKNQADLQHSGTIVDGVSRIGWMTGGQAARWRDETMSDTFLNKALEYIEEQKDGPFFLYYATQENHVPREPHPRFRGSSSLGLRGDALAQMDWNVGRILEKLEALGIADNTWILFSSDNGPVLFDGYWDGAIEKQGDHKAAGPWRGGKYSVWEGGTRMPLISYWPAKVRPGLSDALVSQMDLYASIAAIVGLEIEAGGARDSVDLGDTLLGKSTKARESVIQQGAGAKSIRKGDWKYVPEGLVTNRGKIGFFDRDVVGPEGELFYLPEDPGETTNLSSIYPNIASEMAKAFFEIVGEDAPAAGNQLGGAFDKQ